MTDPTPPDDELLSALLDGECSPAEAARLRTRLAAEPALAARLAELSAAATLTGTPVDDLDHAERDRLIGAALAAHPPPRTDNVHEITARTRRRPRVAAALAVAAGIVLIALAVPALQAIDGDDDPTQETAIAPDTDAAEGLQLADADGSDAGADEADSLEDRAPAEGALDEEAPPASTTQNSADGDAGADFSTESATAAMRAYEADAVAEVFGETAGSDLIGHDLGAFANRTALRSAVLDRLTNGPAADGIGGDAPDSETSTDDTAEESTTQPLTPVERATARLDAISGCGRAYPDAVEDGFAAPVVAVDLALAVVADSPTTVVLFSLADESAVIVLIDNDTCRVVQRRALVGG